MAGCCECGDEPSGSCATKLVSYRPVRLCIPCTDHQILKHTCTDVQSSV
jgi:hypothetical protein